MNLDEIKYCPGSLAEGFSTYSPSVIRNMFFGKKVSHILDFDAPELNEEVAEKFRQNSKSISISGAQFKQSLRFEKNKLRLTELNESGQYILKPVPFRPPFGKADELPANEHLTMQIAKQVYGIQTAECALVFFKNGQPAYITKRFDINEKGKIAQEDFASLSNLSKQKDGDGYHYAGSYEDMAFVMKKYVSAYPVEIEKLFERIIFNYLFSNGDAHLKNFSLRQTESGDYILSPAYDLIDTLLHIPTDTFFALSDGLFSNDYVTESFDNLGFYAYDDFYTFGLRVGISPNRVNKILNKYLSDHTETRVLISRSFLGNEAKGLFENHYKQRLKALNNSFEKLI